MNFETIRRHQKLYANLKIVYFVVLCFIEVTLLVIFYVDCRFQCRRQANRAAKCAHGFVILDMGENVLQGMIGSLLENGSSGAVDINVDKLRQ